MGKFLIHSVLGLRPLPRVFYWPLHKLGCSIYAVEICYFDNQKKATFSVIKASNKLQLVGLILSCIPLILSAQ